MTGERPRPAVPPRLAGWLVLVSLLAVVNYAGRLASDGGGVDTRDALYEYSTAVFSVVFYGVLLVVTLLLARGFPAAEAFGLRRPASLGRAVGYGVVALVVIYVAGAALTVALGLDAGEEQGLTPDAWDPDRAGAYAVNFVAVALVAPFVEELMYRGFGFFGLRAVAGPWVAIVATAVLFSLAHGLLEGFAILTIFGIAIGWVRWKTDSLWPGVAVHAFFNAVALVAAVTVET